jgi:hypothetical protein
VTVSERECEAFRETFEPGVSKVQSRACERGEESRGRAELTALSRPFIKAKRVKDKRFKHGSDVTAIPHTASFLLRTQTMRF